MNPINEGIGAAAKNFQDADVDVDRVVMLKEKIALLKIKNSLKEKSNQLHRESLELLHTYAPGDLHSPPALASNQPAGQGRHTPADPVIQAGGPSTGYGPQPAGLDGSEMADEHWRAQAPRQGLDKEVFTGVGVVRPDSINTAALGPLTPSINKTPPQLTYEPAAAQLDQ